MEGKARPRILLIAPVGEGMGGIISQTNAFVRELQRQGLINLKIINSAQRYRDTLDLRFFARAWGGSWQAARIATELLISLLKFKPEAVHIRSSASLGLARDLVLAALARLMGAKVYVSFHFGRIPQLAIQRNWEWWLLSWTARVVDGVEVLDSRSMAALADNFPNCKIHQFRNGTDCAWIDEIRRGVNADKSTRSVPRFVFAGMVLPAKGVVELVEACSKIADADFEVEMVGPVMPDIRDQLCGIAARREAGRWLKFTGALSRIETVERIAAADVFVLPSYTEGFPVSVLEAMACGTAIVATSVGALPEMLAGIDGEAAGLVVPPRDTESLKLALEDLLKNPAKRLKLGAAARRKCEANYQLSDLALEWVKLWCR